ncbi:transforming growth factor beta regulator 1 [Coccinella septempunctata]|uniref:transforming growth factor beta regulator 1 n=1 Tax=Coccinella septempunctata TaxID=41139 RepID=UPI001D07AF53|nr:transforming growth factor beta regulator 1 [Coccinella septempunctata]
MYSNRNNNSNHSDKPMGKYEQKLSYIKTLIREYVHENAALVDEIDEVQVQILVRKEERKFLLKKLCEFEPSTANEVQMYAKKTGSSVSDIPQPTVETKRVKRKHSSSAEPSKSRGDTKSRSERKSHNRRPSKSKKRVVPPIPLDNTGKPIFPIDLGRLTVHSLGEVIPEKPQFHTEEVIFPVGYVSTRIYGSLKDPTVKCIYTCKISDSNDLPRFEIASDDNVSPIVGDTPDICHSLLLQKINDSLSLNVVSTRPRGNEFFGLSHPVVLNLIQSCPGTRKCTNYKWNRFEVSRNCDALIDDNDAGLSYEYLQRSINFCRYKMAPDILQKPEGFEDIRKNKNDMYY